MLGLTKADRRGEMKGLTVRSTVAYDEVSLSSTESIQHERNGGGKSDIGL